MFSEKIRVGFDVFARDGGHAFGAVREVRKNEIVIYVENAGDFTIPMSAIADAHSEKVILDPKKIDDALKSAIGHAHFREDPTI